MGQNRGVGGERGERIGMGNHKSNQKDKRMCDTCVYGRKGKIGCKCRSTYPRHSRARTKLLVNSRNKGRSEEREGPTGKMETGRHQVGSSSLKKK